MKTKTINLYTYDELTKEAQDVALKQWQENNEYFYLSEHLSNMLWEYLNDEKIVKQGDPKIFYSLSYSQGDGVMFEGNFTWNGYNVSIKHSGHYYHSNSKTIDITDEEGNEPETDEPEKSFDTIYKTICTKLEKEGYDFMAYEDSEENFREACDANEYTFLLSGKMENDFLSTHTN